MSAPQQWQLYDQFLLKLGKKVINLQTDSFKIALFTSSSNCNDLHLGSAVYSSLTNEVANGNGYTTTGVAVSGVSYTDDGSGIETFTTGTGSWTGSGSGFTFRFAVVYDSTTGDLVGFSAIDGTPADVNVAPGNTINIQMSSFGTFQLSRA